MENTTQKSTTTTTELKYILEKNFWFDACCALVFFAATMLLEQAFGSFCFLIATISFLAMAVNLIFANAIGFGQGKIVRYLCATKPVRCFLMLHHLTSDRVRVILKHIDLGLDLETDIAHSISFRTANELELMDIVSDNLVYGVGYAGAFLMLFAIIGLNYFVEMFRGYCGILISRTTYFVAYTVATNGFIVLAIKLGHRDLTPRWCRMKVLSCFLMLHYHTRERARLVLQKLESERQENLQAVKDARMKDHQVGEVLLFEKGICDGDSCSICSGEYKKSEKVRIVRKCRHCFHAGCLMRLLYKGVKTCPICSAGLYD